MLRCHLTAFLHGNLIRPPILNVFLCGIRIRPCILDAFLYCILTHPYILTAFLHGILIRPSILTAFCDASWADVPGGVRDNRVLEGRRSTLGHVLFLNGGAIQWRSHVSKCVALSSAESELYSTVACAKDIAHGRRLLTLLGCPQEPTPTTLYCDSTAAIAINSSRKVSSRIRHCEIKYFYCKGLVAQGIVRMLYTNTTENCSDLLTKALSTATFTKFRNDLVSTSLAQQSMAAATCHTVSWWEL